MNSALPFELEKHSERIPAPYSAIPPFSEMSFKQKKAERLKMRFSSKKNLEKVIELVAQIAASETKKVSWSVWQSNCNWGCWECAFLLLSWSLFQSYEIYLQRTKSTKHLFHSPVSQCLSLKYPRDNSALWDNLKTGRQIKECHDMYVIIKLTQMLCGGQISKRVSFLGFTVSL